MTTTNPSPSTPLTRAQTTDGTTRESCLPSVVVNQPTADYKPAVSSDLKSPSRELEQSIETTRGDATPAQPAEDSTAASKQLCDQHTNGPVGHAKIGESFPAPLVSKNIATDVAEIDAADQTLLAQCSVDINRIVDDIKRNLISLGKRACQANQTLSKYRRGLFRKWIATECRLGASMIYGAMQVYSKFGDSPTVGNFEDKALLVLSYNSTPESARAEALIRAEAGERITVSIAKGIIEDARSEEPTTDLKCDADEDREEPPDIGHGTSNGKATVNQSVPHKLKRAEEAINAKAPSKIVEGGKTTKNERQPTEKTTHKRTKGDVEQSAEDAGNQASTSNGHPTDLASSADGAAGPLIRIGSIKRTDDPDDTHFAPAPPPPVSDELKAMRDRLCDILFRVTQEPLPDKAEIIRQAGRCGRTVEEITAAAEKREQDTLYSLTHPRPPKA